MPVFLTRDLVYRMLQRELPEDCYPDGAPSAFFSTAENDAVADVAATAYGNLERIYDNYWPQSADESMASWEVKVFGKQLPATLTLDVRRDRVITKIQSKNGLTKDDMINIVKGIIGSDKMVAIAEWGCASGAWIIGVSQLGINTYLGGFPSLRRFFGPSLCEKTAADLGITQAELDSMRREAYTYQVNIYGYVPTSDELIEINEQLSIFEPARSQHVIVSGLDPADFP